MAGITDSMSKMASGNRHGGISEAMDRPGQREPEEKNEEGGVVEHLKALHSEMGGKHIHVHQHEGGLTSRQVGEDGEVEGPNDHESTEELRNHMNQFFDEEEREPDASEHHDGLL